MLIPNMSFVLAESRTIVMKMGQVSVKKRHFHLSEQKDLEPEHVVILFLKQIIHVRVARKKLYRMVSNLE